MTESPLVVSRISQGNSISEVSAKGSKKSEEAGGQTNRNNTSRLQQQSLKDSSIAHSSANNPQTEAQHKPMVDVKKLIEQKEIRERKQIYNFSVSRYFEPTATPGVERCYICSETTFTVPTSQHEAFKQAHIKDKHPQYYKTKMLGVAQPQTRREQQKRDQDLLQMARELLSFATSADNREEMSEIYGKMIGEPFVARVQSLPVAEELRHWAKVVETRFLFHD